MLLEIIAFVIIAFALLLILGAVNVTISRSVTGPLNVSQSSTVSTDVGVFASPPVVTKAQPAVLTTRTNNTSGSLTMTNSVHGIITGQRVDLYWAGGQCYGAIVGTVAGTTVPIASVSGGAVLPAATTAISVGPTIAVPFAVTGANIEALVMACPSKRGYFVFSTGSDVYGACVAAGGCAVWTTGDVGTNPVTGSTLTQVFMSTSNEAGDVSDMTAFAAA